MLQERVFHINDRVWLKTGANTWWPAKVTSVTGVEGVDGRSSETGTSTVTVLTYPGTQNKATYKNVDSHSSAITFFEPSSEKAVTANEDLLQAIRNAEEDKESNALRFEPTHSKNTAPRGTSQRAFSTSGRAGSLNNATQQTAGGKRSREVSRMRQRSTGSHLSPASDDALVQWKKDIDEATDNCDGALLTSTLLKLASVSVTLRQLLRTKIGVSVSRALSKKDLEEQRSLATCIISAWTAKLPEETVRAIEEYNKYEQEAKKRGGAARSGGARHNKRRGTISSSQTREERDVATPSTSESVGNPITIGGGAQPQFVDRVQKLLLQPGDPHSFSVRSDNLRSVAEKICAEVTRSEDRMYLLEHLSKPGLSEIRRRLAMGELSGKDFLELSRWELMTQEEKEDAERRTTEKLRNLEETERSLLHTTSLFECPECHGRECEWRELQIRSADEPTTKFIKCIKCKHNWSEN